MGEEGHGDKDSKAWRENSQDSEAGGGLFSLVTHMLLLSS